MHQKHRNWYLSHSLVVGADHVGASLSYKCEKLMDIWVWFAGAQVCSLCSNT